MHTHKVILPMLVAGILAAGCFNYKDVSSKDEVDDLKNELAESKLASQALQDQYVQMSKEISMILNELSAIAEKTANLRRNYENGSARLTQAEQIFSSIDNIKSRIASIELSNEALTSANAEFKNMIESLKKMIDGHEKQILILKKDIETKEKTIREQKETIEAQLQTIKAQEKELKKKVAEQAKLLCEAGIMIEEIADNAPHVSWKKNREKVGDMVQDCYQKALLYYKKSYEAGYEPAGQRITQINAKIAAE